MKMKIGRQYKYASGNGVKLCMIETADLRVGDQLVDRSNPPDKLGKVSFLPRVTSVAIDGDLLRYVLGGQTGKVAKIRNGNVFIVSAQDDA